MCVYVVCIICFSYVEDISPVAPDTHSPAQKRKHLARSYACENFGAGFNLGHGVVFFVRHALNFNASSSSSSTRQQNLRAGFRGAHNLQLLAPEKDVRMCCCIGGGVDGATRMACTSFVRTKLLASSETKTHNVNGIYMYYACRQAAPFAGGCVAKTHMTIGPAKWYAQAPIIVCALFACVCYLPSAHGSFG